MPLTSRFPFLPLTLLVSSFVATAALAAPQRAVGRGHAADPAHAPALAALPMGTWHAESWEDAVATTTLTEATGYRMATETKAWYATGAFNAVIPTLLDLSSLTLSYSETTDGRAITTLDAPLTFSPDETDGRCVYGPAGDVSVRVCRKLEEGITTVTIARQSKDVVYHAEESGKAAVDTHDVSGAQTRLGLTVTMDVRLTDGRSSWVATPAMVLLPTERSGDEPRCFATPSGQTCTRNTLHGLSKQGNASSASAN